MKKVTIISKLNGSALFEHEAEENSLAITLQAAIKAKANLSYADLSCANLYRADLSYADLSYADLSYANLYGANLSYADLSYANLYGATPNNANLYGANLSYANLSYADLNNANLCGASLNHADISYADLNNTNLCGATLNYANLRGATLESCSINYATFRQADFSGANVSGEVLTKTPLQLNNLTWPVLITDKYLRIGCQRHTIEEWKNFDDKTIREMDHMAVPLWRKWKTPILALCDAHAATVPPTVVQLLKEFDLLGLLRKWRNW